MWCVDAIESCFAQLLTRNTQTTKTTTTYFCSLRCVSRAAAFGCMKIRTLPAVVVLYTTRFLFNPPQPHWAMRWRLIMVGILRVAYDSRNEGGVKDLVFSLCQELNVHMLVCDFRRHVILSLVILVQHTTYWIMLILWNRAKTRRRSRANAHEDADVRCLACLSRIHTGTMFCFSITMMVSGCSWLVSATRALCTDHRALRFVADSTFNSHIVYLSYIHHFMETVS